MDSNESQLFEEIKRLAKPPLNHNVAAADQRFANYDLLHEIHRGGQGIVYQAIQKSTKRVVAIKLILHGSFATEKQKARFEREVEIACRLSHPNIVTVYDGGVANGQPFCVMEYVAGKQLDFDAVQTNSKLNQRQAAELFSSLATAVGYAHQKGVIHRDLKPGNILIDPAGQPKVLDFGLAKFTHSESQSIFPGNTNTGEFLGTVCYASPEQTTGDPSAIDTRSDVYSLGVIMYELIKGELPYPTDGTIVEILQNIVSHEPAPLQNRETFVDEDLETIVLTCLSKDPQRRYANASDLARDLDRYLAGEPISARRDSTIYLLRKIVSKHRQAVAGLVTMLLLAVAGLLAVLWFYFQALADRDLARSATHQLKTQKDVAEFQTYIARIAAADASVRSFATHDALRNLYQTPPEYRGWEYWYIYRRNSLSKQTFGFEDRQQSGHRDRIHTVHYSPLQNWIVSGGWDGRVVLWDLKNGQIVSTWYGNHPIQRIRFHPQQRLIAVGFASGQIKLLSHTDGEQGPVKLEPFRDLDPISPDSLHGLEFSPDGQHLLIAAGDYAAGRGCARVVQWHNGETIFEFDDPNYPIVSIAWHPDGKRVALAGTYIYLWDALENNKLKTLPGHDNWINCLAFHPDGEQLASCANEPQIKLWNLDTGEISKSLFGHTSFVNSVCYNRDGSRLASGSADKTLRIWDPSTGMPLKVLWGQYSGILEVAYGGRLNQLASCGTWCVKTWDDTSSDQHSIAAGDHQQLASTLIVNKSSQLITSDKYGAINRYDLTTGRRLDRIASPSAQPLAICPVREANQGTALIWGDLDGNFFRYDLPTRQREPLFRLPNPIVSVEQSGDSYFAATDDKVYRWSTGGEQALWFSNDQDSGPIRNMIASPCGRWLAIADSHRILVLRLETGKVHCRFERESHFPLRNDLCFSPDGQWLAFPAPTNQVHIWSISDRSFVHAILGHSQPVESIAFTPDGRRLATSSREGKIKIWDTHYFEPLLTLQEFSGYARTIQFSADGLSLVAGLYDGSCRVWQAMEYDQRPKSMLSESDDE